MKCRETEMTYEEWLENVPKSITDDSLWNFETYRKALFLSDLAWIDCDDLVNDSRGRAIAWQLLDSAGSIAANIEEGYGRGFGKDYARFLRIALGSARETRGWYYRGRQLLDPHVIMHRMRLLDEIISGLVTVSNQQRQISS
jgi:four helix bundle protein